jgi:hypothetical protein
MWLGKVSMLENAKLVANEVGFNDSPFFGAEKKKIRLMGELVMVNTALAIFAVNQVFDARGAKSIIDPFLSIANKSIFSVIEKKDSDFKRRYEQRMSEYFRLLSEYKPAIELSFSFMKNLGLDPLGNLKGQVLIAARFGDSLTETLDVLRRMTLSFEDPLQEFEHEIESWPVSQAKTALLLIKAILSGNNELIDKLYPELTVSQFKSVESVIIKMEDAQDA